MTAVDASVQMLARSRSEVVDSTIRYIQGDVFTWAPDRVYDTVFVRPMLTHAALLLAQTDHEARLYAERRAWSKEPSPF